MNKYENPETGLRRFTSTCPIRISDRRVKFKMKVIDANGVTYRYGKIISRAILESYGLNIEEGITVICEVEEMKLC